MKLNFKTILLIFLISILGGIVGTFGVLEINKATDNKIIEQDSAVTITTVEYPSIEKSNYAVAIDKVYNSVVEITSTVQTQSFFGSSTSYSLGSGVIVSSDGYIVTNNHVVKNSIAVSVKLYDGETYEAEILGTDTKTDLAVLKIDAKDLDFVAMADSSKLILGEECVVIGNPLGEGISCSNGIISALEKEIIVDTYSMTVIQTNAAVNEGNSGGGLFNMNGDLIGIVNAKSSGNIYDSATVEGMGYAIPSNTVKRIITDLVDYGYVKQRATLGVEIYSNTAYNQNGVQGCIVANVLDNGAADKAGIEPYDIISAIDDEAVDSYSKLSKILDNYNVGDEATITVYRGYGEVITGKKRSTSLEELKLTIKFQEAVK